MYTKECRTKYTYSKYAFFQVRQENWTKKIFKILLLSYSVFLPISFSLSFSLSISLCLCFCVSLTPPCHSLSPPSLSLSPPSLSLSTFWHLHRYTKNVLCFLNTDKTKASNSLNLFNAFQLNIT
jgi:hypothetical protein